MRAVRNRRERHLQSPIELRFIDLFMIIVAALIFIVLSLAVISSFHTSDHSEPLEIMTRSLPSAVQGYPYHLTLAGTGGVSPYSWRVVDGRLPDGLSLDQKTGRISGIPRKEESTSFTVNLTDMIHPSASTGLTLQVRRHESTGEALRATGVVLGLPNAVISVPYYFQFETGGASPHVWKLVEGELPPGLNLTPKGEIVGALNLSHTDQRLGRPFRFKVEATDSMGRSLTQEVALQPQLPPSSSYFVSFILLVTKWVGPVLALNLIVVLILAFVGFQGGIAAETKGLISKLKKLSRTRGRI